MNLAGKNVLVVEDSPLIAASAQEMLSDLGCEVVGPAGNMADAYELCQNANVDVALIDLNIRGSKSFRLLKALSDRKIPFILASGYADWTMPEEWAHSPRLQKPYTVKELERALLGILY